MCKSLTFLSGKGGSGKTTLALSIASMLSNCDINVLVVDCDLSTNGATYFHEAKLDEHKKPITSFYDLLYNNHIKDYNFVKINEHYDFLPSITKIGKLNTVMQTYPNDDITSFYSKISKQYDIILFDCQSGYTDILTRILPITDITLVVMETDTISSASIRSLYLKIGSLVNERRLYQVFNKASKEEYETYSKVSGGTVFTNLDTILFDWKIRRAFSLSQIPDMENTSANYGIQIYNLCYNLFTNIETREKLSKIKTLLDIHGYQEEKEKTIKEINSLTTEYNRKRKSISKTLSLILTLLLIMLMCLFFIFGISSYNTLDETNMFLLMSLFLLLGTIMLSIIHISEMTRDKREHKNDINAQSVYLSVLEKQIDTLNSSLSNNDLIETHVD